MVPARFIAETLGKEVDFDASTNTVLIYGDPYSSSENQEQNSSTTPQLPEKEPEKEPVEEPEIVPVLTGFTHSSSDSSGKTTLTIKLTTDIAYENTVSPFALSNPNRAVFDIPKTDTGAKIKNTTFSDGPVTAIRFGHDSERTRVVVDVSGEIISYKATQSDTLITLTVVAKQSAEEPEDDKTTTPTTPDTNNSSGTDSSAGKNNSKKIIVIDAGHGGSDPGAISEVIEGKTIREKDITLSIAKKTKDILTNKGYNVILTRSGDTYPSLTERAEIANDNGAAIFVSIHMNSSPSEDPSGTETYYCTINNDDDFGTTSQSLAQNIQSRLYKALQSRDRGVKTANHAVTKRSLMPAVLIEVGFISNADEAALLTTSSYQNKAASAIAEGIIATWKNIEMPDNWDELAKKREEALN